MKGENSQFIKRFKSFLWRTGMMGLAFVLSVAAENIGLLELPPELTLILGLILGEVSKVLNNRLGNPS